MRRGSEKRLWHYFFKQQLFIFGSCRSEEFYSTTSEHLHVKMSASKRLSQPAAKNTTENRESEVIVCWLCGKIKPLTSQMVQ